MISLIMLISENVFHDEGNEKSAIAQYDEAINRMTTGHGAGEQTGESIPISWIE
jgi:hypothetical protein